ncbi:MULTISPECIES: MalM family protein [unclassified Aeromonas]|uniref:MalM family protein n=1 Tax=unclassified Aeromonas TaxID=257493 RepID=UPI001C436EE7|nr:MULTISPECIES: MalM family protein [unclassified Aeromonas]MBV7414642.1 transcriptional regulator [Aeromonas sp. sif2433]MBV7435688.1 transcriptional regulator [Aeromonas sp. sif2416]
MKLVKMSIAAVVTALLAGCSGSMVVPIEEHASILSNADQAKQALSQTTSCCKGFNEFNYVSLPEGDTLLVIDGKQPSYQFDEGMSYFAAYRLPANTGNLAITVASQVSKTVLVPKVIMLDAQFKVTRVLGESAFTYQPAYLLNNDRIEGNLHVNRSTPGNPATETYMVVYAPADELAGSTTILHPAKAFARANGTVEPDIKDPVIPHSPWGLVQIEVVDTAKGQGLEAVFKPEYSDKVAMSQAQPAIAATAATTAVVAATPSKPAPAMLTETETFYNSQIEKAVKAGDIDKAMQLVNEAERAGSTKAKSVFIDAVKRSQKN